MTLALLLGGAVALAAAWLALRELPAESARARAATLVLALFGPVIAIAMLSSAYSQGQATADAPTIPSRLTGQVRIALIAARLPAEGGTSSISIGSNPARDAIVVGNPPGAIVTLAKAPDGIVLAVDQRPAAAICVNARPLAPGERRVVPVAVFALASGAQSATPDICADPARRVKAGYRNLTVRLGRLAGQPERRMWQVAFDDREIRLARGGRVQPASADLAHQPREGRNVVAFASLGGVFAPLLEQVELVLPQARGLETYVRGRTPGPQSNENVRLRALGHEVQLRIDPLNLTAGLRGRAPLVVALTLAVSLFATMTVRLAHPLAGALLGLAEILLTLRVLIAVEGGMVEETLRSRGALGDALLALPLMLLVLTLALAPWRRLPVLVVAFCGCAFAVARLIVLISGALPETSREVLYLAAGLGGGIVAFRLLAPWLSDWIDRGPERRPSFDEAAAVSDARWPVLFAVLGGFLIAVFRGLLLLGGVAERMPDSFALSLLFVPLTLLGAAPLLAMLARTVDAAAMRGGGIAFLGYLLFAALLPNLAAGDDGLALVLVLALAIAGAVARLANPAPVPRAALALVASLALAAAYLLAIAASDARWWWLALPLTALAVASAAWRRVAATDAGAPVTTLTWLGPAALFAAVILVCAIPSVRPAVPLVPSPVPERLAAYTAVVRALAVLAPERLDGIDSAAETREALEHARAFADTSVGRGFLNLPLPPRSVKKQQFSDFVVAIHVISPFGRLAAAGLVLLLAVPCLLALPPRGAPGAGAWFGGLATIAFAATSLYIILANAGLLPLTGRNAYLLAVQSHSDLAEGTLLLAVAAVLLAGRRPEAST